MDRAQYARTHNPEVLPNYTGLTPAEQQFTINILLSHINVLRPGREVDIFQILGEIAEDLGYLDLIYVQRCFDALDNHRYIVCRYPPFGVEPFLPNRPEGARELDLCVTGLAYVPPGESFVSEGSGMVGSTKFYREQMLSHTGLILTLDQIERIPKERVYRGRQDAAVPGFNQLFRPIEEAPTGVYQLALPI